jgi:uncharacterized protein with PIN domain
MDGPPAKRVFCRFYAELNDFLPPDVRQRPLARRLDAPGSVKDVIESFGVPHPEVDLILVNGRPADFGCQVGPGDRVAVYPRFRRLAASGPPLRAAWAGEPRFLLDVHLGRLASYLRLAGFDAAYARDATDAALAAASREEGRALLTRDRGLLKRREVERGYWVRETAPRRQLAEVLQQFDLAGRLRPLARCGRCNGRLTPVERAAVEADLPPRMRREHHEFHRCDRCGRVYWRGSHVARIERLLARAIAGG